MAFTFYGNNTEVAVFNQKTGEYVTNEFTDLADDYDNIAYGVSSLELIEILVNVKNYENSYKCVFSWIRKVGKKDERNADMGSKWN